MKRTFDLLSPLIAPGETTTLCANIPWRGARGFELANMRGMFLLAEPTLVGKLLTLEATNQGDKPARLGLVITCDTNETEPEGAIVDFPATWPADEVADDEEN